MITIQTHIRINAINSFIEIKDVPPGNYKVTLNLEEEVSEKKKGEKKIPYAGCGKDLIDFISPNFNDPMDEFRDYI